MKLKILGGAALLAALIVLNAYFPLRELFPVLLAWMQGLGPLSVVAYLLIFTFCALFFIPVSPLLVLAATLYGFWMGYAVAMVSGLTGISLAYVLGKRLWRDRVEKLRHDNPRFETIYEAISKKGPLLVFLIRLNPFLPFSLINYLFTIPKLDFRVYLLCSALGMTPDVCFYLYAGEVGRGMLEGTGEFTWWNGLVLALALVATLGAGLIINGVIRTSKPHA